MGALRTIVATAVIVFALTTVAMAGVQRLGARDGQTVASASGQTSYTVKLTDRQLDKLLAHVRDGDRLTDRTRDRRHEAQAGAQHRDRQHDAAHTHDGDRSGHQTTRRVAQQTTTHASWQGDHHDGDGTQHGTAPSRAGYDTSGGHDGHHEGSHSGDGGCD